MPKRIRNKDIQRRSTKFRAWRLYRKLSLEKASAAFDMSVAQLSRVERGEVPYTSDFVDAAEIVYQTDWLSLLLRDPSQSWNEIPSAVLKVILGVSDEKGPLIGMPSSPQLRNVAPRKSRPTASRKSIR